MAAYISTRGNFPPVSVAAAVKTGMVPAGGIFLPETTPVFTKEQLSALYGYDYIDMAREILAPYLDDFFASELMESLKAAYSVSNFYHKQITPLVTLNEKLHILELWHGPTAAFKDVALQLMPYLLTLSAAKIAGQKELVILVATSGDTGKAALEGFKNVPGIKIIVFYPYGGVSRIQELQMVSTDGDNTHVAAVRGNFDDCQNAVKELFADRSYNQALLEEGFEFSSANSINWGRLAPQIVYYFRAYADLLTKKVIKEGEKINFVVPTGNFGNILAGWYAEKMGLPINKLICASNVNKILTDFFRTGLYDRRRELKLTSSPSMDILISSNLERFLFETTGRNGKKTAAMMEDLQEKGFFSVEEETVRDIRKFIAAGFADEEETLGAIREVFDKYGYLLDPHTAVGYKVLGDYVKETGDKTVTVLNATASPYKFGVSVLQALRGKEFVRDIDEFTALRQLEEISKVPLHPGLRDLDKKPVLHREVCEKTELRKTVKKILFKKRRV